MSPVASLPLMIRDEGAENFRAAGSVACPENAAERNRDREQGRSELLVRFVLVVLLVLVLVVRLRFVVFFVLVVVASSSSSSDSGSSSGFSGGDSHGGGAGLSW